MQSLPTYNPLSLRKPSPALYLGGEACYWSGHVECKILAREGRERATCSSWVTSSTNEHLMTAELHFDRELGEDVDVHKKRGRA